MIKFPNQIDDSSVDQLEALINIENVLGVNPNEGFSTVSDRLNNLDKQLKSFDYLTSIDYIKNLNLATILSLNNCTDEYDIILGEGSVLTGIGEIVNIKGDTTLIGNLNITGNIKNSSEPIEQYDIPNKLYIDNKLSLQFNKFNDLINNISNKNNFSIQYTCNINQPFPEGKPNQFLKRNKDNDGWEFSIVDIDSFNNKFDSVVKTIENVRKNNTGGCDLLINSGDAIKSEDDYINLDANVVIHKKLMLYGDIDLQSHRIINSLFPEKKGDIANKQYVDTRIPTNLAIENQIIGSMLYFDGTKWVSLNPGEEGDVLIMKDNAPIWSKIKPNTNF